MPPKAKAATHLSVPQTLKEQKVTLAKGLSAAEVEARQSQYGRNELDQEERTRRRDCLFVEAKPAGWLRRSAFRDEPPALSVLLFGILQGTPRRSLLLVHVAPDGFEHLVCATKSMLSKGETVAVVGRTDDDDREGERNDNHPLDRGVRRNGEDVGEKRHVEDDEVHHE